MVPCNQYPVLRQLKHPTFENRKYLVVGSQPCHLIIMSFSGSWSYKLTKLQPGAAMLDGSFILAKSVIHLITVVSACLLGLN